MSLPEAPAPAQKPPPPIFAERADSPNEHDRWMVTLSQLVDRFDHDLRKNILLVLENTLQLVQGQLALYCQFDPVGETIVDCATFGMDGGLSYEGPLSRCFWYPEITDLSRPHFLVPDLTGLDASRNDPFVKQFGFTSCMGTCVRLNQTVLGALLVFDQHAFHFGVQHTVPAKLMSRLLALIYERQKVEKELHRRIDNVQLISEIASKAMASAASSFLRFCLDRIGRWAQVDCAAILWYDEHLHQFLPEGQWWSTSEAATDCPQQIEPLHTVPFVATVLREKTLMFCLDDLSLHHPAIQTLFAQKTIKSLLAFPLYTEKQIVGLCLMASAVRKESWEQEDIHTVMTLATIIAQWREVRCFSSQLEESTALIYQMVELSPAAIYHVDLRNRRLLKVNDHMVRYTGFSEEELLGMDPELILTPQSRQLFRQRFADMVTGRPVPNTVEYQIRTKNGDIEWGLFHIRLFYENGQIARAIVVAHFITEQKKTMEELADYRKRLEGLVKERTRKLSETNKKLKEEIETHTKTAKALRKKTEHLHEVNTAMGVLLDKRNEDRLLAQEHIRVNLSQLIEPYLNRLEASGLNASQRQLLDVVRTNLNEVVGAPIPEMTAKYYIFTPNELQVANLIRKGRTTKDIARLLNLSARTVESYRNSVRKKLGLQNRKVNLRTYLSSQ